MVFPEQLRVGSKLSNDSDITVTYIKKWMDRQDPNKIDSYYIVFSDGTGGHFLPGQNVVLPKYYPPPTSTKIWEALGGKKSRRAFRKRKNIKKKRTVKKRTSKRRMN
jgi:hypothetical protein